MSTRSETIIMQECGKYAVNEDGRYERIGAEDREVARFYRHCDGYPTGHGLDMAYSFEGCGKSNLRGRNWVQVLLGAFMLGEGKEGTPMEEWGAPCIEFEPQDVEHGDLEYLYTVRGSIFGEVTIAVRRIGWDEHYADVLEREPLFEGTPREYIEHFGNGRWE